MAFNWADVGEGIAVGVGIATVIYAAGVWPRMKRYIAEVFKAGKDEVIKEVEAVKIIIDDQIKLLDYRVKEVEKGVATKMDDGDCPLRQDGCRNVVIEKIGSVERETIIRMESYDRKFDALIAGQTRTIERLMTMQDKLLERQDKVIETIAEMIKKNGVNRG